MAGEQTLVRMEFGSHVYGTATPESDRDYKGVFLPSGCDILLQRAPRSRTWSSGSDGSKNSADDVDVEYYALHHYLKHLCDGQTVAVDMAFVPEYHWVEAANAWRDLVHARYAFISANSKAFIGYCRKQADKYGVKGSRMGTVEAAVGLLRSLPAHDRLRDHHSRLSEFVDTHDHANIDEVTNPRSGFEEQLLAICGKRAPYSIRVRDALAIYSGLYERYGERARAAKDGLGIDWKALMHAVRVVHQIGELYSHGTITFPRPEADLLLRIRRAELPFHEVAEMIEGGVEEIAELERACWIAIQRRPNRGAADAFVRHHYRRQVTG